MEPSAQRILGAPDPGFTSVLAKIREIENAGEEASGSVGANKDSLAETGVSVADFDDPEDLGSFDAELKPESTVEYVRNGAQIDNFRIMDRRGRQVNVLRPWQIYTYAYDVEFLAPSTFVRFGMMVKLFSGLEIGGQATAPAGGGIELIPEGARWEVRFRFQPALSPGIYSLNAGVLGREGGVDGYLHRVLDAAVFRVDPRKRRRMTGHVDLSYGTRPVAEPISEYRWLKRKEAHLHGAREAARWNDEQGERGRSGVRRELRELRAKITDFEQDLLRSATELESLYMKLAAEKRAKLFMGRYPFPDESTMFMESSIREMLENGHLLIDLVNDQGFLKLDGSVVDVGCGYGRSAYTLLEMGFTGHYLGFDILSDHIRWLSKNLSPVTAPAILEFKHLDVVNDRYNPTGKLEAAEAILPSMEEPADLIIAFSVFTHMYPVEVAHYLRELSLQMTGDSILCASFFLMNQDWEECEAQGKSTYPMDYVLNDHCRYNSWEDPLYAIAFREDWLLATCAKVGLVPVGEIHLGSWCGRGSQQPCYQDTIFFKRSSEWLG